MSRELHQVFPRKEGGQVVHHSWAVDLARAGKLARGRGFGQKRLRQEVEEMGQHLPRWITTVSRGRELVRCGGCDGLLVFHHGLCCVACGRSVAPKRLPGEASLAWFGLMPPVGVDGLPRVDAGLAGGAPAGHVSGRHASLGRYLLVPLVLMYPARFPVVEPEVFYQPGFFQIPGMPSERPSHEVHLLDRGRLCLFASGEWRSEMTAREVLQQRAYAHLIKMLNFADGKRAAFAKVS